MPIIEVGGGGVSDITYGCEKYLKLLRFDQYSQVCVDGIRRDKDEAMKGGVLEHSAVKAKVSIELFVRLKEYLKEPRLRDKLQKFCEIK